MILVDTSCWVDHLRSGLPALERLLESSAVLTHPYVVGEIACGNLRNRKGILSLMLALPIVPVGSDEEVLGFIERHELYGRGIGYVDAHLLVSTRLAGDATLWTRDRRLRAIAETLEIAHRPT